MNVRNKIVSMAIILVIGIISMSGCSVVPDNDSSASDPFVKSSQFSAGIASLQQSIATKADKSDLATKVDIATVTALLGGSNNHTTTVDSYTKSEIDAKISALRAEILAQVNSSSNSNSNGSTTTNNDGDTILSTNGDIDLILERAPGDEEVWVNDTIPVEWRLTVKNRGNSGTYFRINANFDTTDTAVLIADATLTPSYSQSSMIFTPNPLSSVTAINNMAFTSQVSSTESRVWIPKNSSQSMYMVLTVNYTDPNVKGKRWSWDFNIRQLN